MTTKSGICKDSVASPDLSRMKNDPRLALERRLRQELKYAEKSATYGHSALVVIEKFLMSWETLEDEICSDGDNGHCIPQDFLRHTMCVVHKALGHGHEDFQKRILSMLRNVQTSECRALVLEFVPLTLPSNLNERSLGNVMRASGKRTKKEVLNLLTNMLQDDTTLFKQVFGTLSLMTASGVLLAKDVFQFYLDFLPKTPENELHIVLQALIQYAETGSDAQVAADAVRTELSLLAQTNVSDMFYVVSLFDKVIQGAKSCIFVEQYLAICEEILEEACPQTKRVVCTIASDSPGLLSVFDWTIVLLAKQNEMYFERIATMIHESITNEAGCLFDLCPVKFVELLQDADAPDSSRLRQRLIDAYMDSCLTMFLSCCHLEGALSQRFPSKVGDYVRRAIVAFPRIFQNRWISRLFCVFGDVVKRCQKDGIFAQKGKNLSQGESRNINGGIRACREIISIAAALVDEDSTILIPFQSQVAGFLEADYVHSPIQDRSIVLHLCKVTAKLSMSIDRDGLDDRVILLCRRLLFSSEDGANAINRQLRGCELLNAIVKGECMKSDTLVLVCRMVTRILDVRWSVNNQCVGVEAIKIMKYLHLDKGMSHNGKEAIGQIISKGRIVQYPQNASRESMSRNVVVRCDTVPKFLLRQDRSRKQLKFRAMVCSFDAFLAWDKSTVKPNTWKQSSIWMYTLFEAFLAIGRPAKWIPQAWTEAGIEFPLVAPNTFVQNSDKASRLSAWFDESFGKLGFPGDISVTAHVEDILLDVFQSCAKASDRVEVLQFSYNFTLSLLLALSVSAAVLNNMYDYFKKKLQEGTYEQRMEVITLLQHQLVKLYWMKQHCLSMQQFFDFIPKNKRKRGRQSVQRCPQPERNEAAEQTHDVLQLFFSSDSFINSEAVWVGLADPEQDSFIISTLNRQDVTDLSDGSLLPILTMRLNMLSHLSCRLKTGQIPETLNVDLPECRQRMAQFLRMALFLSHPIQNLREAKAITPILNLVDQVSKEYFRLLHHVLVSISGFRDDVETVNNDNVVFFSNLYQSLIGSSDPMNDAIHQGSTMGLSFVGHIKTFGPSLFAQLQRCSAAVGMQLLESLSVLAILASRSNPEFLHTMIDLNWEAMKLKVHGAGSTIMDEPPFALDVFIRRFCPSLLRLEVGLSIEDLCVKETLLKLICQDSETGGSHTFLSHLLCRHWSLVSLSQRRSELLVDHLSRFLVELRTYLEDNDKPKEITVPSTTGGNETPQGSFVGEHINSAPPSKERSESSFTFSDSFPCLNSDNCCEYFDSLLKLTVASVGTFSVIKEVDASRSHNSHPFANLESYFELCGSLVDMLKDDDGVIFAELISQSVVQTLKLLLDISMEKMELCIDWQNSEQQLAAEEVVAEAYDHASKNCLKDLMEVYCVEIIGTVERLCSKKKNDQRLASLNRKVEQVYDFARQICMDLDLGDVKTQYSETSDTIAEPKAKRRKAAGGGRQQFDASTIEEQVETNDRKDTPESEEDEASWSGGSTDDSSESGAFGVSGDWGQRQERENNSGDDDSSRQLGEISIIH